MKRLLVVSEIIFLALMLNACGQSGQFQDLQDFMAETKRRPHGQIDPLPSFTPYQPFSYSAMTLRSPFEKPVPVDEKAAKGGRSVAPDPNRVKEFLEGFNITSLKMVGSITKGGKLWALIDNGEGSVVSATLGNYLGKNNGKIISADASQLEVMEIVADGSSGWVERPRIIKLEEKE